MTLFLVRHGQTLWNREGRAQGHTDVELDDEGRLQAAAAADALSKRGINRVISSDLKRSADTASAISTACGVPLELSPLLRERSFGDMEGALYHEVRAGLDRMRDEHNVPIEDVRAPNGESVVEVHERIARFLSDLPEVRGNTVIVTHGGTCGVLLAQLLRAGLDTPRSFRFDNASITEIAFRGHWVLQRYNDTSHLVVAGTPMIDVHHAR